VVRERAAPATGGKPQVTAPTDGELIKVAMPEFKMIVKDKRAKGNMEEKICKKSKKWSYRTTHQSYRTTHH
jgi:hypothetical protein